MSSDINKSTAAETGVIVIPTATKTKSGSINLYAIIKKINYEQVLYYS